MFDSISKALAYLKQSISQMFTVKRTLDARLGRIQETIGRCVVSGNQECLGKMILLKAQTEANLREYESFMQKLGPFRTYFETNTIGVFPVFVVTGAVGLASALYLFFEKIKNEGKALDLIQTGMLKPSEAKAILSGGGIADTLSNASTLLMVGIAGYLLFLFSPSLVKGRS